MDFEKFKDRYQQDVQRAISFIGQDVDFFTEVKAKLLLKLAEEKLGNPRELKALDIGCGVGLTDRYLSSDLGELHGVDISQGVIEKARLYNPSVHYQFYDGKKLPFPDAHFDFAFAICVIQCIPGEHRPSFLQEMLRVVKKGGLVVVFEHNPFNPLTRKVVNRCEMNKDMPLVKKNSILKMIKEIGLIVSEQRYILFFPWRWEVFRKIENYLGGFPLGAQYFVAGRKPY